MQKRMLDGELGEPVRQGMETIVELGKFWEAPDIIPVRSVHMAGASVKTARRAGRKHIRWIADEGGKFVVTATLNPAACDLTGLDLGVPAETVEQQREITDSYRRMGGIECHTCTPYLVGNAPLLGQHIAWGESSAIVYSNSVLGARTNREGGPSGLASALTGYTANYGMHLKENRLGTVRIDVDYPLSDLSEFGCAAYYAAKNFPDAIPVFTGLPAHTPVCALKEMAAALATSGSVSMYHAVGITPEAPTLEAATGGRQIQVVKVGRKEIEETKRFLNRTNESSEVDSIFIGCPHMDFDEIRTLARLLEGRKVNSGVKLWLFAAHSMWENTERSGFNRVLRDTGAILATDTCPNIMIFSEVIASNNFKSGATDSTKLAHYLPSWGLNIHYGSTEEVVEAAVTGKWRV